MDNEIGPKLLSIGDILIRRNLVIASIEEEK